MKRALAMALGAVMVAGSAAPATAASHIDFSGYYRIMYMSETNTSYGREDKSFTDSYFQDRLQLDLTFSPTDEISVYWRLRGPGSYQRWGRYEKSDKSLYTQYIYGEIKQDWGTFLVGRISDDLDAYGLASLGYSGTSIAGFTNAMPFDRADILDGVRYSYAWDNGFGIMAQYGKMDNNGVKAGNNGNYASDQDWDRYQVEGTYAWDGGGVSLNVFYDRNATSGIDGTNALGWSAGNDWYNGALNKIEQWGLNPSIMHAWDNGFSIHFEGMAMWGSAEYAYTNANGRNRTKDMDGEGYGAYLDFDYNYGPGNATLAGWWVSGSDLNEMNEKDPKSKSIADLAAGNFYPLLVAYNGDNLNGGGNRYYGNAGRHLSGIGFANNAYENYVSDGHAGRLVGETTATTTATYAALNNTDIDLNAGGTFEAQFLNGGRTQKVSFNNDTDANHWAVALTGNHAFTDDISVHYGLAYLALNKANYRVAKAGSYDGTNWTTNGYTTQDKDLGFEIDLGVTIQLLDNLKFSSAFGYMFNGDAYKQLKGYNVVKGAGNTSVTAIEANDSVKAKWQDADDSYVWFNSLTFAF